MPSRMNAQLHQGIGLGKTTAPAKAKAMSGERLGSDVEDVMLGSTRRTSAASMSSSGSQTRRRAAEVGWFWDIGSSINLR